MEGKSCPYQSLRQGSLRICARPLFHPEFRSTTLLPPSPHIISQIQSGRPDDDKDLMLMEPPVETFHDPFLPTKSIQVNGSLSQ